MPHGKNHVATGALPVRARAKPGAASPISRSLFAEARSLALVRSSRFMRYLLVGQRGEEFKPKAEAIFRADDRGEVRARGHVKFNFEQVPRAQQDAGIKNHATLAKFRTPARNHGSGKPFCGDDSNGQINGNTRPAARLMGDKHSVHHLLFPSRVQITEVQADPCSTVQWAGPTISRRFWHGKRSRDTEDVAQLKKCHTIWRLRTPSLGKCGRQKKIEIRNHAEGALAHLR